MAAYTFVSLDCANSIRLTEPASPLPRGGRPRTEQAGPARSGLTSRLDQQRNLFSCGFLSLQRPFPVACTEFVAIVAAGHENLVEKGFCSIARKHQVRLFAVVVYGITVTQDKCLLGCFFRAENQNPRVQHRNFVSPGFHRRAAHKEVEWHICNHSAPGLGICRRSSKPNTKNSHCNCK